MKSRRIRSVGAARPKPLVALIAVLGLSLIMSVTTALPAHAAGIYYQNTGTTILQVDPQDRNMGNVQVTYEISAVDQYSAGLYSCKVRYLMQWAVVDVTGPLNSQAVRDAISQIAVQTAWRGFSMTIVNFYNATTHHYSGQAIREIVQNGPCSNFAKRDFSNSFFSTTAGRALRGFLSNGAYNVVALAGSIGVAAYFAHYAPSLLANKTVQAAILTAAYGAANYAGTFVATGDYGIALVAAGTSSCFTYFVEPLYLYYWNRFVNMAAATANAGGAQGQGIANMSPSALAALSRDNSGSNVAEMSAWAAGSAHSIMSEMTEGSALGDESSSVVNAETTGEVHGMFERVYQGSNNCR